MPNTRQVLPDRFIILPAEGIVQSAWDSPVANADITKRLKAQIATSLEVERQDIRDCRDEDLVDRKVRTRRRTLTLTINEVNDDWLAYFSALYLGTAAAPTGTPANEVQTLTRSGTVSGGTFKLSMTLEGRTVTTQDIAYDATNTVIQDAITAARMLFIQPGDVVVTGTWGTAITLTHPDTGRLGRANLPLYVLTNNLTGSTPDIVIAQGTAGAQNFHAFTRSTARTKQLISFCLGWETDTDRVEKYINYAVTALTVNGSLDGDLQLVVTMAGMWDYDSIETTFTIPDCNNVTPMPVSDVRLIVNSVYQTTDINSFAVTVSDNVPLDRQSAYGFDGVDLQRLYRGLQPSYSFTLSVFGSEVDPIYELAHLERTQAAVPVIFHFGMPGHRVNWNFDKVELSFQTDPLGNAGALQSSVIQLDGTAFKNGTAAPFDAEAYVAQTVAYLLT